VCFLKHDVKPGAPNREAADEYSTEALSGCLAAAWLMAIEDASFGAETPLHSSQHSRTIRRNRPTLDRDKEALGKAASCLMEPPAT
jgi:hypothetical protein